MPADLDTIFDRLRAEADAVPLNPPTAARRRGTKRTQARATIATALAVCLVGGGGAWLLKPDGPAKPAPAAPATARALPEIGTPIGYGGKAVAAVSAIATAGAYTLWQAEDGTIRFFETRLDRPAAATSRVTPVRGDLDGAVVLGGSLVVGVRVTTGYRVYGLDPAKGTTRWTVDVASPADLVLFEKVVIARDERTGRVTGIDANTGKTSWTAPTDPGTPLLSMSAPEPPARAGSGSLPLIQPRITDRGDPAGSIVTLAGNSIVVRLPDTGKQQYTLPSTGFGVVNLAHDGRLFTAATVAGQDEVAMTPFTGPDAARVLHAFGPGRIVTAMVGCGTGRVCVADAEPTGADARVTMLDYTVVYGRETVWSQPAPGKVTQLQRPLLGGGLIAVTDGGTAVYGLAKGALLATGHGQVARQDDRKVVVVVNGQVTQIRIPGGEREVLGRLPVPGNGCVVVPDRLICPGTEALRMFRIPMG
ncbi:PQQ-binding-like beta-propeller repeat protein [Actinoplanes sp. N902-109]|uniref:outer membrane protein assembly factor BamB family protein n=1 Tax=Actinoplanes sp. (strain N902-109) TaxID=649831 RepID=UPI0003293E8B|nr:PQQ-binding-like beta-propeller repeat protein [Actinoplanes sp. N902-109]AGL20387.1 hypothetical protein L083_6877 [Actinoplanes sp. N902-109]